MRITPLILAAGASRRMGTPKALLDFDGRSALELVLAACRASRAAAEPIVVLGWQAATIRAAVPKGVRVVLNEAWERGQTSSLKAGLAALPPGAEGMLLFPVDFPLVAPRTVARILEAPGTVVVPACNGRRGHPALFRGKVLAELLALGDDEPAHEILRRDGARVHELPVEDRHVLTRLNTPEDYAAALAAWRAERGTDATPAA